MAAQKVQHPSKQSSIHSNIFVTNNKGSIEKPKRPVFHSLGFQLIVNACKTSRDRPKSAPYLRLKNSKRTSICQSIGELGTLS